jgi:hypothetical protein
MKRTLTILALAALSAIASASSPIDAMFQNCQEVMDRGVCRVALDVRDYPAGGKTLISGIGRVSNESIIKLRDTRTDKQPDGTFTMCALAKQVCTDDWNSDDCKVVRGSWKQTPVVQASLFERVYAWFSLALQPFVPQLPVSPLG